MKSKRPILELEWTNLDYVLEAIAFTAAVASPLIAFAYYAELPDTIPIHFNARGLPDGWGGKGFLWLLPILGLGIYALMTYLNRFPHTFNYPVPITAENALWQYTLATRAIRFLKTSICVSFALITWFIVKTALGQASGVPFWLIILLLTGMLVPVGVIFFAAKKKN